METSVHPSLPTSRRRPARRRSVAVALATSLPAAAAEPDDGEQVTSTVDVADDALDCG